jgi:DNA primase
VVTRLPDGLDPAEWLQVQGVRGLRAFDRRSYGAPATDAPIPRLPGRDLVRICLHQPGEPVARVLDVLTPLATQLSRGATRELIAQAEHEMTARGANTRGQFAQAADAAIDHAQHLALVQQRLRATAGIAGRSPLSTETPRPDAHQVA